MPDSDIRDLGIGRAEQDNFLIGAWPLRDAGRDAAHGKGLSGVYCLVVITRPINTRLSIQDRKGRAREAEELISKFMSLVWHDALAPELINEFARHVTSLRFADLVTMETMNSTLWSRPEHRLYDHIVFNAQGDPRLANEEAAETSYGHVTSHPQNMGETIQEKACEVEHHPDGTKSCFLPQPPKYIRILYDPLDGEGHPLKSFQTIQVRDVRPEEDPIDGGGDRTLHSYILLLAVRRRAQEAEPDCIRTFSMDGMPIEPRVQAPYTNTDWHVGEPGH
ncbi:hypothetical protein CORC01_10908 [Colletotrichum orchidophilum]|uniref:Uncharacterized protein n=1 Tax=Colletotrichum orchidophilum TaxID=1209926 RepID=A0A1G4AXK7_9PEZI|nr:uncharacterized protein CORC01_10908 [Colletotrichum orchidophilum]OHE93782.1 hypothetical protein CORC01_10908 [Colletotrichum orchidophilum]